MGTNTGGFNFYTTFPTHGGDSDANDIAADATVPGAGNPLSAWNVLTISWAAGGQLCIGVNGMMWGQRCVDFHADRMPDNSASILRIGCSNHDTDAGGTTNPDGGKSSSDQGGYPYKGDIASATYFDDEMSFADQQTLNYKMRASASLSTCTGCAIVSNTHSTSDNGRYGHFSTACMERTLGAVSGSEQGKQLWVIRNGVQYRTGYAQVWPTPNHAELSSADGWGHMRWGADSYPPPQTFPAAAGDWQIGDIFVGSAVDVGSCLY